MSRETKWRYCRLDQVARLVSGRTPDRGNRACYADVGLPWVKIENLGRGVVRKAAEYLSEEGQKKVNPVPEGSVLFSTVGTVGQVGIAGCTLATNQQIVSLIFQEDQVSAAVRLLLSAPLCRRDPAPGRPDHHGHDQPENAGSVPDSGARGSSGAAADCGDPEKV
ncbi:MAG: restriction endonuclease subunit S [Lachnospiraceae bacterium]